MGHKNLEAFPIWGPQPRLSWLKTWASPRYNHVKHVNLVIFGLEVNTGRSPSIIKSLSGKINLSITG